MSTVPPAAAPDTKRGLKGKQLLLKKLMRENKATDDDLAAVDELETTEDVEPMLAHYAKLNGAPDAVQKVLADKEKALIEKQKQQSKLTINAAGTPPDKLPGSRAEDVAAPFIEWNSRSVKNAGHVNILEGAAPLFVREDGDEVMF